MLAWKTIEVPVLPPVATSPVKPPLMAERETTVLPDGLIAWRTCAELHGMAPSTVRRAIDGGRLTIVEGEWKVGRVMVRGVLDREGQAQFYGLYRAAPGFKACPQCPHQ